MLKNYIKIAYRNLLKHKLFSLINISGLAVGLSACLIILQYVSFESNFDRFHQNANNIYRVSLEIFKDGSSQSHSALVAPAVGTNLKRRFPAVENYTRMVVLGPDGVLTHQDQFTSEKAILLADSSFFDIFSYQLLKGNKSTALTDPFSIVITETTAKKLFGENDPINQEVVINAENFDGTSKAFRVTGVVADFPNNTHLTPGVLVSYPTLFEFVGDRFEDSWQWNHTHTYVRLNSHADPQELEALFPEMVRRINQTHLQAQNLDWKYHLQPITDIHLYSDLQHEFTVNGNSFYVWTLSAIGLVILLIAFINFVNLVTVRAMKRAREVGIRKVSGALRNQLMLQFFFESFLINALAMVLAFTIIQISVPYFSEFFEVNLAKLMQGNHVVWSGFLIFYLLLVLGSGFYPAVVLSGYLPIKVLKGNFTKGRSGARVRKLLVVSQFTLVVILIVLTYAVSKQIRFMQKQALGYNPQQVLVIKAPKAYDYGYGGNFSSFQNRAQGLAQVTSTAGTSNIPGQEIFRYSDELELSGKATSGVFSLLPIAPNYFRQFDIPVISGRSFDKPSYDQWIINETASKMMGFEDPEAAIGQTFSLGAKLDQGEVIGVVKDYHHQSLKTKIDPVLFYASENLLYYTVKLETDQLEGTLAQLKTIYQQLFPGSPYEYFFLDNFFQQQYQAERKFQSFFSLFSGLTIFIASLGLLALTTFMAAQRTKEVSIRKVMGASVTQIIALLSKDLIRLVLFASILGIPLAYLLVQQWLANYAYRIELSWLMFAVPLLIVLLVTVMVTGLQTLKAAVKMPVKNLRYDC